MYFQATGAGAAARLNVTGWSGDREVLTFDVTHTGSGGNTARIAGKRDGRGNVNADFDADAPPYAAVPSIQEGVSGIITEYVSITKFIQTPVIIKKLHFESAVGSQCKWNFDWEMNSLAGSFVYPAT